MEGQESLLDTLFDEENLEDGQDVEMLDVEEGEFVELNPRTRAGESSNDHDIQENKESNKPSSKQKKRKKKNKRKRGGNVGPNVTDINRFVLDACKRLRETKSYLMYTAVGCLGVAALSDLIKEVDAIQACGGQKTSDGSRFRKGGGILWNIIKARDPNAYKEIMRQGREFEKQFKQQKQEPAAQHAETPPANAPLDASQNKKGNPSGNLELGPHDQSQRDAVQTRASVHERIRMPVIYDDCLFGGEDPKDKLADDRAAPATLEKRGFPAPI
ncbi:uncharacterized protein LOC131015430 [Salvia miltiorrhiza]|uniref:uncharacterized protein LOC131015430 n=1 Tax=Salvia miltiorrhiza TaxID=226208 RepID=UPI0025AC2EB8|nr:uncharacterized protein LOC131015430 [Salvia miltiorrhiza]XP_057799813.1 uncharacterized protein LOC131015430 [Salvia miltiorrhiza]XP_057799814.1 uncharacterized protein LOC131015430 [Salvia miltiorrhiza]